MKLDPTVTVNIHELIENLDADLVKLEIDSVGGIRFSVKLEFIVGNKND